MWWAQGILGFHRTNRLAKQQKRNSTKKWQEVNDNHYTCSNLDKNRKNIVKYSLTEQTHWQLKCMFSYFKMWTSNRWVSSQKKQRMFEALVLVGCRSQSQRKHVFHYDVEGKRYNYHPKMVLVMLLVVIITKKKRSTVYNLKQHMLLLTKLNQAKTLEGATQKGKKPAETGVTCLLNTWRGSPPSTRWKMWWNMWTNTSRWEPTSSLLRWTAWFLVIPKRLGVK